MADEEHTSNCRLQKKLKANKVPKRGMGVAQLEKIILEQRQVKDAGDSMRFRRPLIPPPPPLTPNRRPLVSKSGFVDPDFDRNYPRLYNFDDPNLNRNQNLNRFVFAVPQFPTVKQRSQFLQPSSSMVNVSSSVMNNQIEPPSNQSYCDGQMIGMKRSYSFLTENIPIPSFNCKFPSVFASTSCSKGGISCSEVDIPFCREKPSSLNTITKDFLTLAPPKSSPPSHSMLKEMLPPSSRGQTRDSYEEEWSSQQPLISFFPEAKTHGTNNGEVEPEVDLSLKL